MYFDLYAVTRMVAPVFVAIYCTSVSTGDELPSAEAIGRMSVEYRVNRCSSGSVKLHVYNEGATQSNEFLYEITRSGKRFRQIMRSKLPGNTNWSYATTQIITSSNIIEDNQPDTAVLIKKLTARPDEDLLILDFRSLGMVMGGTSFLHKYPIDAFHNRSAAKQPAAVAAEKRDGLQYLRVDTVGESSDVKIWYSPSQGYSVARMEVRIRGPKSTRQEVTESTLQQYPNGAWYPAKVIFTQSVDGVVKRLQRIETVSASFGDIDESVFSLNGLDLSPGRTVIDSTSGYSLSKIWDGSRAVDFHAVPEGASTGGQPPRSNKYRWWLFAISLFLFFLGCYVMARMHYKKARLNHDSTAV